MRSWFEAVLGQARLSPEAEGYLLARGARPESIRELQLRTWDPPRQGCTEDPAWAKFGAAGCGEHLRGMLVVPLWSARGQLLGADFRAIRGEKQLLRYQLPDVKTAEAKPRAWSAVFVGMLPRVARALWAGAELWLVEGLFDLLAVQWVLPRHHQVLACGMANLDAAQLLWLRRLCPPRTGIYVVMDMDKPGRRGVRGWRDEAGTYHKGIVERLNEVELHAHSVPYLGKDPGELWDRGGAPALRKAFGFID